MIKKTSIILACFVCILLTGCINAEISIDTLKRAEKICSDAGGDIEMIYHGSNKFHSTVLCTTSKFFVRVYQ